MMGVDERGELRVGRKSNTSAKSNDMDLIMSVRFSLQG